MLERNLYLRSPREGSALWLSAGYTDAKLGRVEIATVSRESDAYVDWTRRESADNGRTWSAPRVIPNAVRETPAGGIVVYPATPHVNPVTGRSYLFTLHAVWPGNKCYTYDWNTGKHPYVYHVLASENGGVPKLLRYEDGPEFDPNNPFNPAFVSTNSSYFGTHPAFGGDGAVYYPVNCFGTTCTDYRGVCLFRHSAADGNWRPSNLQPIAPEQSSIGLDEPAAACLRDGRVLVVCRGHCTPQTQGVKWMLISSDGGRTLSPVEELRYDDGTRLYSPSSIHRFVRSTRSGKLYWLANITRAAPQGQSPRYPLCIAEIDEAKAAVIKESVTMLDDRRPGEPEELQLSNFSVIENRETGNIEIYMTLLGLNPADFWGSDVYRYVFSPP